LKQHTVRTSMYLMERCIILRRGKSNSSILVLFSMTLLPAPPPPPFYSISPL
jgi:hypothetical protein